MVTKDLRLDIGNYTEVNDQAALRSVLGENILSYNNSELSRELAEENDADKNTKVSLFGISRVDINISFKRFSMQVFCGGVYAKVEIKERFTITQTMAEGFLIDSTDQDLFFLILTKPMNQSKLMPNITRKEFDIKWIRPKLEEFILGPTVDTTPMPDIKVPDELAKRRQGHFALMKPTCSLWIPKFIKRERRFIDTPTLLKMNTGLNLDETSGISEGQVRIDVDLDYPILTDGVSSGYHRDDVLLGRDYEFFLFSRALYIAVGLPLFQSSVSQLDFLSQG